MSRDHHAVTAARRPAWRRLAAGSAVALAAVACAGPDDRPGGDHVY